MIKRETEIVTERGLVETGTTGKEAEIGTEIEIETEIAESLIEVKLVREKRLGIETARS